MLWPVSLYRRWFHPRAARRPARHRSRPGVRSLEDRCLLSNYTVTTAKDILGDTTPGEVTLRDVLTAINTQAPSGNAMAGTASNTIRFAIGNSGTVETINIGSGNVAGPLPVLVHQAMIDGWSQGGAGYHGLPLIVLNGANAGADANGLEFDPGSDGSLARGLIIQQFSNNGIDLHGVAHTQIVANSIGTDASGTAAIGNGGGGITLDAGAHDNTIGGTQAGAGNTIVGSLPPVSFGQTSQPGAVLSLGPASIVGDVASFDIELHYTDTPPEQMVYLGLDIRNSSSALAPVDPSTGQPDYSAFNFLPSSTLGSGWAPVGNAFPGEFLFQTPPPPGTLPDAGLQPNATYLVGTLTYNLAEFGIQPSPALTVSIAGTDTTVGTEVPGQPSTFNFLTPTFVGDPEALQNIAPITAGVTITGAGTTGNRIIGNFIGVTAGGRATLGHVTDGIVIDAGATGNMIGPRNVIGGNDDGIVISDAGTSGNLAAGNGIGTNLFDASDLANTLAGILMTNGTTFNTIGGTGPGAGNLIAFNGKGVVVGSSPADKATQHNAVLGDRIFANIGPGIDLGNDGPTANASLGPTYPNMGQAAPLIMTLTPNRVSGTLASAPGTPYLIQIFASPAGDAAQGKVFLGSVRVSTNAAGSASFAAPISTLPPGMYVTATATNLVTHDTSEFAAGGTQVLIFSQPVVAVGNQPVAVMFSVQVISDGRLVTSGQVTFKVAGVPGQVTVAVNAHGLATATFELPAGLPPGTYTISADYAGEDGVIVGSGLGILSILPSPFGHGVGRRWDR